MIHRQKKNEKETNILVLIDFENLFFSLEKEKFSIEKSFERIIQILTEDVGRVEKIFVFLPPDRAMLWGKELYKLGFEIVNCPRIKSKDGHDEDTTDTRLMELGEWLVNTTKGLTHLAIFSGDKDFEPLLRKAALKGLKRIIVAANPKSLSARLIKFADKNQRTGKKMGYIFTLLEE